MSTEVVSLEQNESDNRHDTIGEIESFVEDATSPGKVLSLSGRKLVPKRPLQYYTLLRSKVVEKSLEDAVPNTQCSKLTLDPLVFMGCKNTSEFVNEIEQHLDSLSFEEISLFGKVCWAMFDYSWFKLSFLYIMVI